MSAFTLQSFLDALTAHLPPAIDGKFCVAFSGGLDSSVLLHALARLRAHHSDWRVRALHIDHRLQTVSSEWAEQCRRIAGELAIECAVHTVTIAPDDPRGLEAAARAARYDVFRRELNPGEILLTAHHADDQAETVLLALARGSGLQGLAAMPACKPFAQGWQVRPLLEFTRDELEQFAREHSIQAINDPTNALRRHDRNFLRHDVLPALRQRWPSIAINAARSAHHLGEALELLDEVAATDLRACAVDRCIDIQVLRQLSASRRHNLLRYWFRVRGLLAPSTRKLLGLEHDLFRAASDRVPEVRWSGAELHWYRGLLYVDSQREAFDSTNYHATWNWERSFALPANLGSLTLMPAERGLAKDRLPSSMAIRFRNGDAKMMLPGREHHHSLRALLQEHNVLPWWRDRIPLLYVADTLVAVGDFCIGSEFVARPGEEALQVNWSGAPKWRAVEARPETRDAKRD